MNDKELLKKCWNEYTDQFDLFGDEWQDLGCDEIFKAGFEAAKRTQPSVVLPKREKIVMDQLDAGYNMGIDCCAIALTSAGIKYTIG